MADPPPAAQPRSAKTPPAGNASQVEAMYVNFCRATETLEDVVIASGLMTDPTVDAPHPVVTPQQIPLNPLA